MIIIDKTNTDTIREFARIYSSVLVNVLPDKSISVFSEDSKIARELWGEDTLKRDPMIHTLDNVLYNRSICDKCGLSPKEIFALLLYEIGHIVNDVVDGHDDEKQCNEFIADNFVCENFDQSHLVDGLYKVMWKCELNQDEKQRIQERIARINIKRWDIPIPQEDYMVVVHCSTYNHGKYIESALKGFVMQKTNFRFCAIVIDDGSTDNAPEVIRKYAEQYPDIIKPILLGENHMQHGKSRNPYFEPWHKRAKYHAYCEGDDYWIDPLKLQKQVDIMEKDASCTMVCNSTSLFSVKRNCLLKGGRVYKKNQYCEVKDVVLRGGDFIATCSLLFRPSLRNNYPGYCLNCHVGDYPLQIMAAMKGRIYYLSDVMSVYRIENNQSWVGKQSSLSFEKKLNGIISEIRMLKGFAQDYPKYRDLFYERIFIYLNTHIPLKRKNREEYEKYTKIFQEEFSEQWCYYRIERFFCEHKTEFPWWFARKLLKLLKLIVGPFH